MSKYDTRDNRTTRININHININPNDYYNPVIGYYLTNKEALTALCSVVRNVGSGRARKKCRGKHETQSSVNFSALLECSTAS